MSGFKSLLLLLVSSAFSMLVFCQEKKLYDPSANAEQDIHLAIQRAKQEHKFVLIQGGGNWCPWCIEFARFCKADPQIDSVIQSSFVWYHLNYSKDNKNLPIFEKYGYPQRFGYPVFIILNENGERLNTQNSSYLEDGKKSYDKEKVLDFLKGWSPAALDPKKYQEKK